MKRTIAICLCAAAALGVSPAYAEATRGFVTEGMAFMSR